MVSERRTLRDLNKVYRPVTFEDADGGDPIKVWLFKLSQPEADAVERAAGAAKARMLLERDNVDGDEFMAHMNELMHIDDPNLLLPFVFGEEAQHIKLSAQARIGAEPRWDDDDLLDGLIASWFSNRETGERGLDWYWTTYKEQPDEDPDDPDLVPRWLQAQEVNEKLREFEAEVDAAVKTELGQLYDEHRPEPIDDEGNYDPDAMNELRRKAARSFMTERAEAVYIAEYARQRTFYATRCCDDLDGTRPGPESRDRYFETIDEFDACEEDIKDRLRLEYDAMMVNFMEGKGSRATTDSSTPSGSPEPQETVDSSGHETATA